MEINLLAAPVVLPPASDVNRDSTSLVPVSRLAHQISSRSDSAYPNDSYVWSVSAGDNGSFHFYALPLKNFLNGDLPSHTDDSLPWYVFAPGWSALNTRNAVAQYQLHANMPAPMYGRAIDVYA